MGPTCVQCGMCCMVSICPFGEEIPTGLTGECGYLTIDENDQAVCTCEEAVERYVGSGCIFLREEAAELRLIHFNVYHIDRRMESLKDAQ
jgi:hypothetical protein